MVRVWASDLTGPPLENLRRRIQSWLDYFTEWIDDPVSHRIERVDLNNSSPDDPNYNPHHVLSGDFRFVDVAGETPEMILGDAGSGLQSHCQWYRVGYHRCDHEQLTPLIDCSWDTARTREWTASGVSIPPDVPTFN